MQNIQYKKLRVGNIKQKKLYKKYNARNIMQETIKIYDPEHTMKNDNIFNNTNFDNIICINMYICACIHILVKNQKKLFVSFSILYHYIQLKLVFLRDG